MGVDLWGNRFLYMCLLKQDGMTKTQGFEKVQDGVLTIVSRLKFAQWLGGFNGIYIYMAHGGQRGLMNLVNPLPEASPPAITSAIGF
jgi:hypothetical protein